MKIIKKEQITSEETINKIKELMASVVTPNSETSTGYAYYMEDYNIIGKTGTAQIFDYEKGEYLKGQSDYIYSFSGLYPGDDPEIIIYTAVKKPKDSNNYIAPAVKEVIQNISNYLNIKEGKVINTSYKIESYINKDTTSVMDNLKDTGINLIVIGDGNKIVSQYPNSNTDLTKGDNLILLTNNYDKKMLNLIGLSSKEVKIILDYMDINYTIEGNGYVYEQSVPEGTVLNPDDVITIKLKEKYFENIEDGQE